jgi:rhodanese-related sulfurtransferase
MDRGRAAHRGITDGLLRDNVIAMRTLVFLSALAIMLTACESRPRQRIDSRAPVMQGISEMTPSEALPGVEGAYSQLVDVREPDEYASGHVSRARNIPLSTLAVNMDKIEKNEPVYLICRTDNRSREAAKILADAGFAKVVVIMGGTEAWREANLPMSTGPR